MGKPKSLTKPRGVFNPDPKIHFVYMVKVRQTGDKESRALYGTHDLGDALVRLGEIIQLPEVASFSLNLSSRVLISGYRDSERTLRSSSGTGDDWDRKTGPMSSWLED